MTAIAPSTTLESTNPPLHRGTLLLVDDEEEVLLYLKTLLQDEPYRLLHVSCAEDALEVMKTETVNVILTDDRMPGRTGSELLALLAKAHPSLVGMILTARPTIDAAITAINDGRVFRFLVKTIGGPELAAAVSDAFDEWDRKNATRVAAKQTEDGQVVLRDEIRQQLSTREQQVLERLVAGERAPEIAKSLYLSPHTVRNHLKAIFQKLDVHSQVELVSKARR